VFSKFPRRIYTVKELLAARKSLEEGYKHQLKVVGSPVFKRKAEEILSFIKAADYYDFVRTYIRKISEISGLSQLREAEATIWLNDIVLENTFDGARFIVQKAEQMKDYIDGKEYYRRGELAAVRKSIVFLEKLVKSIEDETLRVKCEETLRQWREARIV